MFMKCMEMILKLSPIGVFCLLCPVIAVNGPMIIGSLAMVLLAAYVCYIIHAVVVYSLAVKTMGGMSPIAFFKGMLPAMMFAFSSASSVGTLPINMECVENMGASKEVTSFVLPLGATINMDGSGSMCNLYRVLLWNQPYTSADADDYSDSNTGIYRDSRCAGIWNGYAGNGTYICRTSDRWNRSCSRSGSYL